MVLYTGAGHQRIIFRCFVYSFVCRCLFTFHGARRGVGRRVARVVCYLHSHRQCNTAAREPACNTHLLFTLFGPLGRREVRCRWELGQLAQLGKAL